METLVSEEEIEEIKKSLPKTSFMGSKVHLVKFQGYWCPSTLNLKSVLLFQSHFQPRDTDLIIASLPKTGTTWLKALLYSVVNRKQYNTNQNPLLMHHPHELVYRLENEIYGDPDFFVYPRPHHLNELPSPRLLHTHLPYASLPESIKTSKCRILYVTRNPLDTFVSHWNFYPKVIKNQMGEDYELPSFEDYFKDCYEGKVPYGPFFDHTLGYWNQSLERENKVLFLKYEDMKNDLVFELKRLADFAAVPFTRCEEDEGVIEEIIKLCSIKNLKELDANKHGVLNKVFEKKTFFRKGEVGDWVNYFTPIMVDKFKLLMDEKLQGTGLSFELYPR